MPFAYVVGAAAIAARYMSHQGRAAKGSAEGRSQPHRRVAITGTGTSARRATSGHGMDGVTSTGSVSMEAYIWPSWPSEPPHCWTTKTPTAPAAHALAALMAEKSATTWRRDAAEACFTSSGEGVSTALPIPTGG